MTHYIIRGGAQGKSRLEVLARALSPGTERLLAAAGVAPGMRVLDLGCGGGDVTRRLAELVGPTGHVVGLDMDAVKLELARQDAVSSGLGNLEFRLGDVLEWSEQSQYDGIYCRFLLTHVATPTDVLRRALRAVRPGGLLIVEDIDFRGHFCEPACAAFDAYVRLYRLATQRQDVDADIGPRLYGMMLDAGWSDVRFQLHQPVFAAGEGKQIAPLTLANIADTLLDEGFVSAPELEATLDDLRRFCDDPRTLVSLPRIFQLWGRAP